MNQLNVITLFLFNVVVYNIALLYGTVGEILTEKSGSLNLGLEGTMAVGAIGGYIFGCMTDSLLVGIIASFICAGICGLIFAVLTVSLHANQNVTGLTVTTFGVGLYFFIGKGFGENWPVMQKCERLMGSIAAIKIPLLSDIPVIGKALFSHNILVYLGFIIAILVWIYLTKTKSGLKLRAVGENPSAADSVGINVTLTKYMGIIAGSGIAGIGGYQMGLNLGGSFEGMNCWIGGYGWIAIALVIFVNWSPAIAIIGTMVFGFFNTLQVYGGALASAFPKTLGWLGPIPSQLYQALPFAITAIILVINSVKKKKNNRQPAAIGVGYFREDR
ncbi:MAG: ABC transporter permease [Eubacteriales bacterium]|jgi:simple sugar transport system permease protein